MCTRSVYSSVDYTIKLYAPRILGPDVVASMKQQLEASLKGEMQDSIRPAVGLLLASVASSYRLRLASASGLAWLALHTVRFLRWVRRVRRDWEEDAPVGRHTVVHTLLQCETVRRA